jgi:hypothetical protein
MNQGALKKLAAILGENQVPLAIGGAGLGGAGLGAAWHNAAEPEMEATADAEELEDLLAQFEELRRGR